ncbi:chemotaxis protein CheC [Pseudoalteromonas tunicata]|uniref:chemotaxis protein CheC n=1 Tax=Pseudoalteromonas tunicata TaxID=314281 RepID=UPI00273F81C2|nr:chemotaxis protein CheC [Pseudoalteromonas tunicata]MDP5212634.1 chemotaxis protein CheC [Pseudoalteromonas tunicata]
MPKQVLLDELEHDLLVELFNIGVGRAADSLSQIVNQEIKLSVPDIEHISVNQLAIKLGNGQEICSVSQYMKGSFEANTILLFPQHSSMEVVSKMLGEGFSTETLAELHQEGFSEIGNIVLNACIGAFGESIEEVFDVSLPVYSMGTAQDVIAAGNLNQVLFIRINLLLSTSHVEGYLVFLLEHFSFEKLKNVMQKIINGLI